MQIFLIIVSLYGGILSVPMNSTAVCHESAQKFNGGMSHTAHAYCIRNAGNAS
ncbi:MAG: hypothetical protein KGL39_06560 [Patescibacteria group bacterium]|nr:hypothetical protein [Patescibacteria group bacterium]